jgi:GNAT superfamily N-acetyltransferase
MAITYRDHSRQSAADSVAVANLMRDIFGLNLEPLDIFDLHDPTYRPLSYFDDTGTCLANVSTVALPMIVCGKRTHAVGICSVATRPNWRRRGLSHDLMDRALAWCDGQSDLVLLRTAIPDFYAPFGFRPIAQHSFVGPASGKRGTGATRPLAWHEKADRQLLRRLLLARASVSDRVGIFGLAGMFVLNAESKRALQLYYLTGLNAVAVVDLGNAGQPRIVDIVTEVIPSLAEILGALDLAPGNIEVCFAPDKLSWDGTPSPLTTSVVLMARGSFAAEGLAFMLPPTAAF